MTTITTVGVYLTEDERGHLTRLCTELEVLEESALRNQEGPEAQTRAAERAALRKLMHLPAGAVASAERVRQAVLDALYAATERGGFLPVTFEEVADRVVAQIGLAALGGASGLPDGAA